MNDEIWSGFIYNETMRKSIQLISVNQTDILVDFTYG